MPSNKPEWLDEYVTEYSNTIGQPAEPGLVEAVAHVDNGADKFAYLVNDAGLSQRDAAEYILLLAAGDSIEPLSTPAEYLATQFHSRVAAEALQAAVKFLDYTERRIVEIEQLSKKPLSDKRWDKDEQAQVAEARDDAVRRALLATSN